VRSTFVINKKGELVEALYGVNPDGHAQAMLDIVRNL
jgi:peroxiredoxin Q/BCP